MHHSILLCCHKIGAWTAAAFERQSINNEGDGKAGRKRGGKITYQNAQD